MGGQAPQLPKSHCVGLLTLSAVSTAFLEGVGCALQRLPVGAVCTAIPHQGTTASQGVGAGTEKYRSTEYRILALWASTQPWQLQRSICRQKMADQEGWCWRRTFHNGQSGGCCPACPKPLLEGHWHVPDSGDGGAVGRQTC